MAIILYAPHHAHGAGVLTFIIFVLITNIIGWSIPAYLWVAACGACPCAPHAAAAAPSASARLWQGHRATSSGSTPPVNTHRSRACVALLVRVIAIAVLVAVPSGVSALDV